MRFQRYAFSLSSKTHRWIRVHTTVLMRYRLSSLMRFQKYAFSMSSKTHQWIRVHTTVLMRYRLSSLMRFQKYAFSFLSKTHRSIRVHTTVLMRFRLSAFKAFENDKILRCEGSWTLRACYKHTHLRHFHFDAFSAIHANAIAISMRFRFDPLSRAFPNRCVFDENAQRISMDGRPKLSEMCALSNENREDPMSVTATRYVKKQ